MTGIPRSTFALWLVTAVEVREREVFVLSSLSIKIFQEHRQVTESKVIGGNEVMPLSLSIN
jgi:hypothetical protein